MGRRRKIITEQDIEEKPSPAAGEPIEYSPEEEELDGFLSRLGIAEGKVAIYRMTGSGRGNREWCFNAGIAEVDEEWIQENCGPGKYLLRIMDARGRYQQSVTIMIAERKADKTPAASTSPQSGDVQITLLRDQLARQHEMLLKLLERPAQPVERPVTELVGALKNLYDMTPRPPDPAAGISSVINALSKGIELAQSVTSGDEKMSWLRMIEHVMDRMPAITGAAPAAPAGASSAPVVTNPNGNEESDMKAFLRDSISYLKSKALQHQEPGLWVDFIAANIAEQHWYRLAQLLQQPFEYIAEADPEIKSEPLRSWFTELFEGLRDALRSPKPDAEPGGDAANPRGNGETDPGKPA